MPNGVNPIVRFGLFEANLETGELRRGGHKVRLQEQPFQVLALLLQKPNEVVTREELHSRLWPADTFVDFDHGLNAAIKRLRDALGDSAENPRFVETLARRGYRFIAPVQMSTGQGASADQPATSRNRLVLLVAVASVVVLVALAAGWMAGRKSVAALAPDNQRLTGNAENDPIWSAALSPDGKYLAFSDRAGFFLRVVNSGETHALSDLQQLQTYNIGWFPDGSHILASRGDGRNGRSDLWSISALGGAGRKLVDDGNRGVISPDGTQIAFLRGNYNQQELWVVGADGEHARKLVGVGPGEFGSLTWAPDGKHLAFVHYVYNPSKEGGDISIEISDPARQNTGARKVVLSNSRLWNALAWTPDNRLVYSLSEAPPNRTDSNLWTQKIDPTTFQPSGAPVRLTSGPDGKARLTLSADGKRLSYLRLTYAPHLYIADVDQKHTTLGNLRRLSLEERGNYPYDWTADSKTIIIKSDRDGTFHLYKQGLDQLTPELLLGGDNHVVIARMDVEPNAVLSLIAAPPEDSTGSMRIVRTPLNGGVPQTVLTAPAISNFQCARSHSKVCLFSQFSSDRLAFYEFDSSTGEKKFLWAIQDPEWSLFNWSLSPDGKVLAVAKKHHTADSEIGLSAIDGSRERVLRLKNWFAIDYFDWAADGRSLWVNATSSAGTATLLNVGLDGAIIPSLEEPEMALGWAIPARDGRHVALWKGEQSSNVWLLQGF